MNYFNKIAYLMLYGCCFSLLFACNTGTRGGQKEGLWSAKKASIKEGGSLRELDLSEQSINQIAQDISSLNQLEKLNLQSNELKELPDDIGQLTKLRKLNLAKNGFEEFPESLYQLKNLEELDLRHNKLTSLPQEIQQMEKLHTLYLAGNDIQANQRKQIRKWLPRVKVIGR